MTHGLYRTDPNLIEMLAPNAATAKVIRTMFGPAWHARKLTEAECLDPWVLAEIAIQQEAGVWNP